MIIYLHNSQFFVFNNNIMIHKKQPVFCYSQDYVVKMEFIRTI